MAAMSRGPVTKLRAPKHIKRGTPSSRRHHFEGFSERIAKLKIEPVRRGRSTILDDAELDASFSYFKDSLVEWRDLNISATFSGFARRVAPLCDSLPQVLHHSDEIFALLVEYIKKGDQNSEEPLLNLLAHFAHDLGVQFERHFGQAVKTVAQLAAKHADIEVIEWSFTCLAWLFKYLSRLLVPDLRPVFDLMAPLLGREHQKNFVTRFAAESLSYLVRKAGAIYNRDKQPLRMLVWHISEQMKDLQDSAQDAEFQRGLMTLFADAIKGVKHGLHSSAVPILEELLRVTFAEDYIVFRSSPPEPLLLGVVTAVVHHSDAEHFKPFAETICQRLEGAASDERYLGLSSRLIFNVCGVRMGDRIMQWTHLLEIVGTLVTTAEYSKSQDTSQLSNCLSAVSTVFQYCPLDAAIPQASILERLSKGVWEEHFLSFSNLFAELGKERFDSLLLPYFKRFITQKAHHHGNNLCLVLPRLYRQGAISTASLQPSALWLDEIEHSFAELAQSQSDNDIARASYRCSSMLDALDSLNVPHSKMTRILHHLDDSLKQALLAKDENLSRPSSLLAAGKGFYFLVTHADESIPLIKSWPSLCAKSNDFGQYLPFWNAMLSLAKANRSNPVIYGPGLESLKPAIMRCLGSPIHDIRLVALGLLEIITGGQNERLQEVISTALIIEQTPPSLESQRSISMRVGQLAKAYADVASHEWVGEAVPAFLFGLLHMRLSSVWDDVCSALNIVCESKNGEAHVSQLAFAWLNPPELDQPSTPSAGDAFAPQRFASVFECTNILKLEHRISQQPDLLGNYYEQFKTVFDTEHAKLPSLNALSRSQALRVLNNMPDVAEKRSRIMVPVLLDWALDDRVAGSAMENADNADGSEQDQPRWSRKDQKAMLSVFSKFKNPKVLYRASAVYDAFLALLSNGDAEIQKLALKAVLAWKDRAITDYQENLFNLLDDARFRDEISVFLDVGTSQSLVKEEHRPRLLPVLLRLLYGRVISGKQGLEVKRKAVFQALTRFEEGAIQTFLDISLGPLSGVNVIRDGTLDEEILSKDSVSLRRQIGMLNMLEDLLNTLKTTFAPFVAIVVGPILFCLIRASRKLSRASLSDAEKQVSHDHEPSMIRTIRQRSLQTLGNLFESCPGFSWGTYSAAVVTEVINPRIEQFPVETAQSVSGLLRLFSAWSKSLATAPFLVEYNQQVLHKIIECLGVPSAKDEVKRYVLDSILRPLISLVANVNLVSAEEKMLMNTIASDIIQPYSLEVLSHVGALLRKSPSRDLIDSGVQTIAELAPYVVGSAETRNMIDISAFLLKQPSSRINTPSKNGLLKILHEFIPRCNNKEMTELFDAVFDAVCPLFASVKDRSARATLCDIVQDLSAVDGVLMPIATLCHDLNSFSTSRLDEPDFERRAKAFDAINDIGTKSYSLIQWKPVVFNMLFFIKDHDELSIRVSASLSLRCFIQASTSIDSARGFLSSAILSGIRYGVRETSELVRVEYLTVLSQLVQTYPTWSPVADLHILLSGDEEASFFGNILHIQSHRRLRALRRLASHAPSLQSGNVYHILLPLLEHFVFDKADDESANSLAGETVKTISALCQCLEWPQFRSLLKRYITYLANKDDSQKTVIKLISGLMDGLNQAGLDKGYNTSLKGGVRSPILSSNSETAAMDKDAVMMAVDKLESTLMRTLPQQERLTKDIVDNVLPDLNDFLQKKDESNVSLRVSVAIAVAKVVLILPPVEIEGRLPSVLLDIAHILRSRAQDSRDMARNTLGEIATFTGPAYLGFILKALRIALQRGYQLHVLSFTLHSVLVKLSEQLQPGVLNYCLGDIVDVIMDDTFGLTGQEKDAEEYISQMKEVKSRKSFDSMDIIARCTTPSHLTELILPIKALLQEKLGSRAVQKIDELLRRIGMGILQNPTVKNRDILIFCYELIQEADKAHDPEAVKRIDPKNRKFLINSRGAAKSGARHSATSYTYKITRFSLDILRTVLRKHGELQTPQNLSGFLPTIGDALVAGQEEVQVAAVRLLTTIIKTPMRELDENCLVYVNEAVTAIKGAPSSNADRAQASLKLITAILRERPNVEIKERHLAQLVKRIKSDLDEPDRQGVTFGFLRAVMNRKIVMPEVYEIMDKAAAMMVTNQTRSLRDAARSSYFQFLMEYPQAKNRFKKQLEFLLRNLRYDHVEGRQSVMEALNLVLTKIGDHILQDELGLLFLPLIHSMANDDSSDCRTMAGALVKKIFERADSRNLKSFVADLRGWLEQNEELGLKRLGIQCWGLYLEVADVRASDLSFVLEQLQVTLITCLERKDDDDWELIYYSLTVLSKLCKSSPDVMFSPNKEKLWATVRLSASYPHGWVKLTAAQLYGLCFADFAGANNDALDTLPLQGSRGLLLQVTDMVRLANAFLKNLFVSNVSEDLCIQSVRNLAFLLRCFAVNGAMWQWQNLNEEEEEDDDDDDMSVEEGDSNRELNGNAESSEEEWGGFSPSDEKPQNARVTPTTAIHRLLVRLSGIIRRETKIMKLSSLYPKSATMALLETLANKLPVPSLGTSLPHLLTTLSTLTDPATTIPRSTDPAFNDTYSALIDKAREVLNILQKRMGTKEYLDVMSKVQKGVRERREERRQKRKVEAITAPEKFGKEKRRRNEVKKVKRKEKSAEYRGKRRGW